MPYTDGHLSYNRHALGLQELILGRYQFLL